MTTDMSRDEALEWLNRRRGLHVHVEVEVGALDDLSSVVLSVAGVLRLRAGRRHATEGVDGGYSIVDGGYLIGDDHAVSFNLSELAADAEAWRRTDAEMPTEDRRDDRRGRLAADHRSLTGLLGRLQPRTRGENTR